MIEEDSYTSTNETLAPYEIEKHLYAVSMGTSKTHLVVYGTLEDVLSEYPDSEITHLGSAWKCTA
tara:strand:- start:313 stop:507 length:195 start_codon:yes stop_codon:yes gene_type:complete